MKHNVLIVDDEKDITDSLERQLRKSYNIFKAQSGIDALKILNKETIHLIISDQRMPEMTGVQLFERAQKVQPDSIRILLTGYTDVESVIAAINNGQIYRYITKPWDPTDLDVIVRRALDAFDLKAELKIKNEQLSMALDELKELDKAKSNFMILIGHELKTPLTSISSFTELLMEENLPTEAKSYVEKIKKGVNRLHDLVFDVLDIMAAETGQKNAKRQKIDFLDLSQNISKQWDKEIQKKNISLKIDGDKEKFSTDEVCVTKVISKLLHNAIKFSKDDAVVDVKVKISGESLLFKVSNEGPTISKENLTKLTQPFYLDEDVLHHSQGTGLGLTVCNSLLKQLNSQLKIKSDKGHTEVSFEIRRNSD
jgi:signal transduction histidine kinase